MERRLFLILIGLLALALSCSKDNSSSAPSVTFLSNSQPYTMIPPKLFYTYPGVLWLICGNKNGDSIILRIAVFKVRAGTYSGDCKSYFSSIHYDCSDTLNGASMTIFNVRDSLIDGVFSAPSQVQTIPAGTGKMSITQGTFKNLEWHY